MIKNNCGFLKVLSLFLLCASVFPGNVVAQTPHWIWHPNHGQATTNGEVRFFRDTFEVEGKVAKAIISVAADNHAEVFINGKSVVRVVGFDQATRTNVTEHLQSGVNTLAVRGTNDTGVAGLLVRLEITLENGTRQTVVSDAAWLTTTVEEPDWHSPAFKISSSWVNAASLGSTGTAPWGDALKIIDATAAESLTVPPGFKVELLRSADANEGSWISHGRWTTKAASSFRRRTTTSRSCASR